ncbi:MAG: porin family protein [Holophagales bacterium]|nr:porin family protein [Holophagales bacterium]
MFRTPLSDIRRGLFRSFAVFFLLAAGPASTASGQMTSHVWELGFAVGSANVDSSAEDFDLDVRSEFRFGYLFSDRFQLEGQLMRADAVFDAELVAGLVNAVFNFRTDESIVPYVLGGLGYYNLEDYSFLGLGPDLDEDSTAAQLGFGSRFFFGSSRQMAARVELSMLWLDSDLFDSDRHTSLTAGLSWLLGQR